MLHSNLIWLRWGPLRPTFAKHDMIFSLAINEVKSLTFLFGDWFSSCWSTSAKLVTENVLRIVSLKVYKFKNKLLSFRPYSRKVCIVGCEDQRKAGTGKERAGNVKKGKQKKLHDQYHNIS